MGCAGTTVLGFAAPCPAPSGAHKRRPYEWSRAPTYQNADEWSSMSASGIYRGPRRPNTFRTPAKKLSQKGASTSSARTGFLQDERDFYKNVRPEPVEGQCSNRPSGCFQAPSETGPTACRRSPRRGRRPRLRQDAPATGRRPPLSRRTTRGWRRHTLWPLP